nr:amidase domain-containing protein [Arsenicicoccus dermatophilus]
MVLVTVDKVNRTGDTATVTTKDSTRLHLRGAGIGLEDYATDVAPRSYTFRLVGGRWQVQGVKDLQELTPQQRRDAGAAAADILTPLPSVKGKGAFAGVTDSPEVTAKLKARPAANTLTAPYNRDKASAYAWRHVFFHNDQKYPTWGGADCTNFVSQVLAAGGWTNVGKGAMKPGDRRAWYYAAGAYPNTRNAATSISWINAQKLADFFRANPQRVVEYRNPANARVGDIVQFQWGGQKRISHSAVVTGVMPWGLHLTYHTTDKLNESLNLIMLRDPGAKAYFFSPR